MQNSRRKPTIFASRQSSICQEQRAILSKGCQIERLLVRNTAKYNPSAKVIRRTLFKTNINIKYKEQKRRGTNIATISSLLRNFIARLWKPIIPPINFKSRRFPTRATSIIRKSIATTSTSTFNFSRFDFPFKKPDFSKGRWKLAMKLIITSNRGCRKLFYYYDMAIIRGWY